MEDKKRCPYCAEEILAAAIKCKHCGSDLGGTISSPASSRPGMLKRPLGAKEVVGGLIVGTLAVMWMAGAFDSPKTPAIAAGPDPVVEPAVQTEATQIAEASPKLEMPTAEAHLIQIVTRSQQELKRAGNDMQKGGVKNRRDKDICATITNLEASNWVGKIKGIGANSDGKGTIEIEIAKDVVVKTWNNGLSDASSDTLIDPNTQLFQTASLLKTGQYVQFSGSFFPGSQGECLNEASLTLDGKLSEPEFIFRFSRIGDSSASTATTSNGTADSPAQIVSPSLTSIDDSASAAIEAPPAPVAQPKVVRATETSPPPDATSASHDASPEVVHDTRPLSVSEAAYDTPDDLAPMRAIDAQAADHIVYTCRQAVYGDSRRETLCRSRELRAWQRLVPGHEFPNITQAMIDKCQQPPFPDTFVAREACAKYETSAEIQR